MHTARLRRAKALVETAVRTDLRLSFPLRLSARLAACALALVVALAEGQVQGADLLSEENAFRTTFNATPLDLTGRVVDPSGTPLAGCTVHLNPSHSTLTTPDGTFALTGLSRSNQLLTVTATGFYQQVVPVQLFAPLSRDNIVIPPIVLWPETPSKVRFLFGGDSAFARRMLDPLEQAARDEMPVENPDAIISVADPLPGTLDAVGFVSPLFAGADYPVVNLESVVTLDPSTPHLQKDFVYFTLPASLPALTSLNIDYVAVGNNHTYDYLESGVSNSIYHLNAAGLHHSGLGTNSAEAFLPYQTQIKGTPYSFLSMTSIGGERFATNYVADANKGGAAYIEAFEEAQQAISGEADAGRVTIVQPHVGTEYTYEPTPFTLSLMEFTVDAGADLVISHHPHVAQGFGMYRGVLLVYCLGNLFFDQDRLETMVGLVATVDMEGRQLHRAWGTPVYLEDYRPRLLSGRVTSVILRRLAEFSQQVRVFPYNGQAWVAQWPSQYSFEDRRLVVPVTIGSNGWTALDLRGLADAEENLWQIESDTPGLVVRPGRDLMNFGDFEDVDVDDEQGEASRWNYASSATVTYRYPYRGTAAMGQQRSSANLTDSVVAFRNRTRVMGDVSDTPNKDVSLLGYVRGEEAGPIRIVARYYASEGPAQFGEETAFEHPGGTFPWQFFARDLHMPPDDPAPEGDPPAVNARALRVFLRLSPPASGEGYSSFDEIAIVNWEEPLDPLTSPVLSTPHARDFLRVEGPQGSHALALSFRRYAPIESDAGHGPDLFIETEQPEQSPDQLWFPPTSVGFESAQRVILRNLGDTSLVVSNLHVANGAGASFAAHWLEPSGHPAAGSAQSISPGETAFLEVRFLPAMAGSHDAVLAFHSNDPDANESGVTLGLEAKAYDTKPVRWISGNRTLSPTVHLQVPLTASPTNLLWETLPAGFIPVNPSHNGQWDPASHTLQWNNVVAGSTVDYTLEGTEGSGIVSGWMMSDGNLEMAAGQNRIIRQTPGDVDDDGLPDWWEQKFFDTLTGVSPDRDSDSNGQNNLTAYLNGQHPLTAGFQAQDVSPLVKLRLQTSAAHLEVLGMDGWTYRIDDSLNLGTWTPIAEEVVPGRIISVPRKSLPEAGSVFYRAVAEP